MFLRMRLRNWDSFEANLGSLKLPISVNNSMGFLEVYTTLEDLKKDYPDEKYYIEIENHITN